MALTIPPTRNHAQLARWLNANTRLVATIERGFTSTDRKLAGTRLIHPGKGRCGLKLKVSIKLRGLGLRTHGARLVRIYDHDSSVPHRRHNEARAWLTNFLNGSVFDGSEHYTARQWVCKAIDDQRHMRRLGLTP